MEKYVMSYHHGMGLVTKGDAVVAWVLSSPGKRGLVYRVRPFGDRPLPEGASAIEEATREEAFAKFVERVSGHK